MNIDSLPNKPKFGCFYFSFEYEMTNAITEEITKTIDKEIIEMLLKQGLVKRK